MTEFYNFDSNIIGVRAIQHEVFKDVRGKNIVLFDLEKLRLEGSFSNSQCNLSISTKGVIRGLHYSIAPHLQDMIVTCISGSIIDISVDIRIGSPTFRNINQIEMNPSSNYSLLIPSGVAHGYVVNTENTIILYHLSKSYTPQHELTINPMCSELNIKWPIDSPILSFKDRHAEDFNSASSKDLLPKYNI
jgi:dTDP-4-dehydrorhamnose 3,5-epimerase